MFGYAQVILHVMQIHHLKNMLFFQFVNPFNVKARSDLQLENEKCLHA